MLGWPEIVGLVFGEEVSGRSGPLRPQKSTISGQPENQVLKPKCRLGFLHDASGPRGVVQGTPVAVLDRFLVRTRVIPVSRVYPGPGYTRIPGMPGIYPACGYTRASGLPLKKPIRGQSRAWPMIRNHFSSKPQQRRRSCGSLHLIRQMLRTPIYKLSFRVHHLT